MEKLNIEWAKIPAGKFLMGSPSTEPERGDDEKQHEVSIDAFFMSIYQVTFEAYDLYCNETCAEKPKDEKMGRGKCPVVNVSWDEAQLFANWLGCRLPTEAEWEFACRAGTESPFSTGQNLLATEANYNAEYPYNFHEKGKNRGKIIPVGSFAPNAWGLYDMHGNVFEWCQDRFGDYPDAPQINPSGPTLGSGRMCRGGSWYTGAAYCRSASRNFARHDKKRNYIGFRLVKPIPNEPDALASGNRLADFTFGQR